MSLVRIGAGLLIAASLVVCGCGNSEMGTASGSSELTGSITIDGSSTVYPIMERMAELFSAKHPKVRVTVAQSGTGGGFKKLASGEIDIADASRPIESGEVERCKKAGIDFVEIPVAFDGLSVVVSRQNDWCQSLTVQELKRIWEPDSKVQKWSDVRPEWPNEKIHLFGPGTDSGTFDYFTKAINGEERASRPDYMPSEDDNVLVMGVANNKYALGYFGYAYLEKNESKLRGVGIDAGKGAVAPTRATIGDQTYQPLSRPLLIYVRVSSLESAAVREFMKFMTTEGVSSIGDVGYVSLPEEAYTLAWQRIENKTTGTVFAGAQIGVTISDILASESGG